MNYRRDIDGLRALSVIGVMLFHADVDAFRGGFVGVDVFFVISGYVITSMAIRDHQKGDFFICRFFERRARRILPSLFFVMAVSIPISWAFLTQEETVFFSKSMLHAATLSSNIFFFEHSGYFSEESSLIPLLHTWSLSLEEQFYFFFPFLFLIVFNKKINLRWSLLAVSFIGLIFCFFETKNDPKHAFYMFQYRSWEIFFGCAISSFKENIEKYFFGKKFLRECFCFFGIVFILLSFVFMRNEGSFPGIKSLIPVTGAALIITSFHPNSVPVFSKVLGSGPFVWVGLVSYSAYLWHFPVISFARNGHLKNPEAGELVLLSILSFVPAYLSWRYLERPFRDNKVVSSACFFYLVIFFISIFIMFFLVSFYLKEVKIEEKNEFVNEDIDQRMIPNVGLSDKCGVGFFNVIDCATADEPEILLWGDSYAMHLADGIISSNPGVKMMQATMTECAPFSQAASFKSDSGIDFAKKCLDHNVGVMDFLKKNSSVKYVVIGTIFLQYSNPGWKLLLKDGNIVDSLGNSALFFEKTIAELKGYGVTPVVFSPTPSSSYDIGRCLKKSFIRKTGLEACDFSLGNEDDRARNALAFLRRAEKSGAFTAVWLSDGMCKSAVCKASVGETLLYRDRGHLSYEGSAYVGSKMRFYDLITGSRDGISKQWR